MELSGLKDPPSLLERRLHSSEMLTRSPPSGSSRGWTPLKRKGELLRVHFAVRT